MLMWLYQASRKETPHKFFGGAKDFVELPRQADWAACNDILPPLAYQAVCNAELHHGPHTTPEIPWQAKSMSMPKSMSKPKSTSTPKSMSRPMLMSMSESRYDLPRPYIASPPCSTPVITLPPGSVSDIAPPPCFTGYTVHPYCSAVDVPPLGSAKSTVPPSALAV